MAVDLVEMPTDAELLVYPINRAEMTLVAHLSTVAADQRHSTALARRGRGRGEARRFAHSGELAVRMPDLFTIAGEDGRLSVEHLDLVWLIINRHLRHFPSREAEPVRRALDLAVECAVVEWIDGITYPSPVPLEALGDLVEEVILALDSDLVTETEEFETGQARVFRRDNRIVLDCGSKATATRVWDAVNNAGWKILQDLKETTEIPDVRETLSACRAKVILDALGDGANNITVTVNLYRLTQDDHTGYGPGFIPGVGWVSTAAAGMLESRAYSPRLLTGTLDPVEAYTFPVKHRAAIMGRDSHCRFPNCTVPASQCQFDHIENSPHTDPTSNGPTSVANGQLLCRHHHKLKTQRRWSCSTEDDGVTIHWIGPANDHYTTTAGGPVLRIRSD